MKRTHDTSRFALALGLTLASGWAVAAPVELISNGGFETGNFTGWTATSQTGSLGALFIDNADGLTTDSGHPTVGSATGLFYAVTDQLGGGAYSLEQSFTVALGTTSVWLSFDMFMNNWAGSTTVVNPSGLDYMSGANQHVPSRVIISRKGAILCSRPVRRCAHSAMS